MKFYVIVSVLLVVALEQVYSETTTDAPTTTEVGEIVTGDPTVQEVIKKGRAPQNGRGRTKVNNKGGEIKISSNKDFAEKDTVSIMPHSVESFGTSKRGKKANSGKGDDMDEKQAFDKGRNSFGSFRNQIFNISEPENGTYPTTTLKVSSITLSIHLKKKFKAKTVILGTLGMKIYTFQENGTINNEGEEFAVTEGTVKFDVILDGFDFCKNDTMKVDGCNDEISEGIDVLLKIGGRGGKKPRKAKKRKQDKLDVYDLGERVGLRCSKKTTRDGKGADMEEGFPKLETKGSDTVLRIRFRPFNESASYDPTVDFELPGLEAEGDDDDDDDNDDTSAALPVSTPALFLLCTAIVKMML